MRTAVLFPLTLVATLSVSGCGADSDRTGQTARGVPRRDLTLREAAAPKVEVASPVELARMPLRPRAIHRPQHTRRPAPASRPEAAAPPAALAAPTPAPAPPRSLSAAEPPVAADPHALAPGRTVTVIPAGGGTSGAAPASAPDWTDQRPADAEPGTTIHGGRGGGGHGPGCGHGGGRLRDAAGPAG
jgi:hypothetical protein